MGTRWPSRPSVTSVVAPRCRRAAAAGAPPVKSTSWRASASNAARVAWPGDRAFARDGLEEALRVFSLEAEGLQRIRQGLRADHVPRLVVEELLHDHGRLPGILDRELGPVEGGVVLLELRGRIVLFLRLVEPAEVHAKRRESIAVLRILTVELDRLLVQPENLLRFDLRHAKSGLRFPEERDGTARIRLRRLVEVLIRGIVIELAERHLSGRNLLVRGCHNSTPQNSGAHINLATEFSRPASTRSEDRAVVPQPVEVAQVELPNVGDSFDRHDHALEAESPREDGRLDPEGLRDLEAIDPLDHADELREVRAFLHHDALDLVKLGEVLPVDRVRSEIAPDDERLLRRLRMFREPSHGDRGRVGPEDRALRLLPVPSIPPADAARLPARLVSVRDALHDRLVRE